MRCLNCGERVIPILGWGSLLSRKEEELLCEQCREQFVLITGECCARCSRPFNTLLKEFQKEELCYDCVRWEEDPKWRGILEKNRSLFLYNDFQKDFISRYKFRGDYVLAKTFKQDIKNLLKQFEYDLLVPIPLSQERMLERGFNQVEALIIEAGLSPTYALSRIHSEKQSKKSRKDRMDIKNVFMFNSEVHVLEKKVIIIDDIYTTGSTLLHAAKVLKQQGAISVSSITIARG